MGKENQVRVNEEMTIVQLTRVAKACGMKGYSKYKKKAELLSALRDYLGEGEREKNNRPHTDYIMPDRNQLREEARGLGIKNYGSMSMENLQKSIDRVEMTPLKVVPCETCCTVTESENRLIKTFRLTGKNLHTSQLRRFMTEILPSLTMRSKIVMSFSSTLFREGKATPYHKTFKTEPPHATVKDIKNYIKKCEARRLNRDDPTVWKGGYIPAGGGFEDFDVMEDMRNDEMESQDEGEEDKNIREGARFDHVQLKIITTNEPLLGSGRLPDWLRGKTSIYSLDQFSDNLCVWRCLAIFGLTRENKEVRPECQTKRAVELAQDFYQDKVLKKREIPKTKLVDFDRISEHFGINIRVFEPFKRWKFEAWQLVYGQARVEEGRPTMDVGMYQVNKETMHCFFIKNLNALIEMWECGKCLQRFTEKQNLDRHLDGKCNGGKTRIVCRGRKVVEIQPKWKQVFYGSKRGHSRIACLWIESKSREIKRHIHHALCGHGGERCIKIKQGNKTYEIPVDGFEPVSKTVYQFHGCYWHGCDCNPDLYDAERFQKTKDMEEKIRGAGFRVVSIWEHDVTTELTVKEKTETMETRDPNGRTIILREIVDIAKLDHILENPRRFDLFEPQDNKSTREGKLAVLKRYLGRLLKGNNMTIYHQAKGTGRYFITDQGGLQSMKRKIRHTIARENMYDIDIKNAHPTFLLHFCRQNGIDSPALRRYVEDREHLLSDLIEKTEIQTREKAKEEIIAIINGRKPSAEKRKIEWLDNFAEEVFEIATRIGEIKPYYKNLAKESNKDRTFKNIEGSTINHLMCDLENQALMIIYDVMQSKMVEVAALVFDGLMIYKEDVYDLRRLLDECQDEVFRKMSCKISLVEKEMDEGFQDIPETLTLFDERKAMPVEISLEKIPRFYPFFIVFDFEAILIKEEKKKTDRFFVEQEHVPVSVAIHSNFALEPIYLVNEDPRELIEDFVKNLADLREMIVREVENLYPYPDDFQYLPNQTQKTWKDWVNQVPVLGFNSGKYDLNLIKEHFVKTMADINDITVAKKENKFMFLTTPHFKFLDVMNYLAPGLSFDGWCRANNCAVQKQVFPYDWLDSYDKLAHVGPVSREDFYSKLKNKTISEEEYKNFLSEFQKRGCVTMGDWLREYNLSDVEPFVEALIKTLKQYYPDEIDMLKDAVSIPGISMNYVLNKSLKIKKSGDPDLYAPGQSCTHTCSKDECVSFLCKECWDVRKRCEECPKTKAYELLKEGMIGGPSIVFTRYAEAGKTKIRSHEYENPRLCQSIVGYDANSLYLWCAGQNMPCGKEEYLPLSEESSSDPEFIRKFCEMVVGEEFFGFAQVDIHVPKKLKEKFSEFCPLFVVKEVEDKMVPESMKKYKTDTGRSVSHKSKKLLGVMETEKILLYSPLIKWYLEHGLVITKVHVLLKYIPSRPFQWFTEEVSNARREGDSDPSKKQLGDTFKLKGNSFYGKMIEDLERHSSVKFTTDPKEIAKAFRSPYLKDLISVGEATEIVMAKKEVEISRPYQCGIAVYQMAKLRMLEFYHDFVDRFIDRSDYELIQMDTDSLYMAISSGDIDDIIKPELRETYEKMKPSFLPTTEYAVRTPGLFKKEFTANRMIALTSKCYYADNEKKSKISCKGVNKRQNEKTWESYLAALNGSIDKARNIGFRRDGSRMITYDQEKLGLSAYYDKRRVLEDGIHTAPLF